MNAAAARCESEGSADFNRIGLVLGRSPHFSALPAEARERMARLGAIVRFEGGELIQPAWQPSDKLWVVLKGGARISMPDHEGVTAAVAIIGEGSYYSVGAFTAGEPIATEAVSVGRSDLARFHVPALLRVCDVPATEGFLLRLASRRMTAIIGSYRDVVAAPLAQRLARRLLSHALAAGHTREEVELRVSQGDLAAMLGVGRSQVSTELRRLQAEGAIRLGYRRVKVRDFARLCAIAGPGVLPF